LPSSLFGLSVPAARVTCGILGTISLIALFFTARKLFTDSLALTAVALAALSPWHLMFSRIAHAGAILPPLFAILIIYSFIIARDSGFASKLSAIAGFLCGLSTNAYQATRVTGSLFLIIILIAVASHRYCELGYRRGLTSFMRTSVIIVLAFILGAAPQIATLITEPQIFLGRALNVTVGFEFSLKFFRTFLNGALANFGPDFLFLSAFEYNNLSIARLIPIEVIPFYIGLATITSLIKPRYRWFRPYLFIFLATAAVPAALTNANPHALRSSTLLILSPLFSSAGIISISSILSSRACRLASMVIMNLLCATCAAWTIATYTQDRDLRGANQQNELVLMSQTLDSFEDSYEQVMIQDGGNQPYIYVISYCKISPADFISAEKRFSQGTWHHFYQVGKYYFMQRDEILKRYQQSISTDSGRRVLMVVRERIPGASIVAEAGGFFFMH